MGKTPICGVFEMTAIARLLRLDAIAARTKVLQDTFLRAYRAANALYEALWDAAAPNATAQVYQGHDHTPAGGGGPIHRGCVWSEMRYNIDGPLFSHTFTSPHQTIGYLEGTYREGSPLRYMTSPGIAAGRPLRGWVCTWCSGASEFFLVTPDGREFALPSGPTERRLWTAFEIFTTDPRAVYDTTSLRFRCRGYDAEDPPILRVWAIVISETDATVENAGTSVSEPSVGQSADLVTSAFSPLDDALVGSHVWVDPILIHRLYSFVSGLFEGVHDWRAPGAASQICRGHDHTPSGYGGRVVARGRQYTAATGDSPLYTLTSLAGSWREVDYDDTNGRTAANIGMIRYLPSEGINTSGSPPSAPPYLTALIFVNVEMSDSATVKFRFWQTGTGNYSDEATFTASSYSGWLVVDKIPCSDSSTNDLTLQVHVLGEIEGSIQVWAIQLTEEPGGSAATDAGSKIAIGGA